MVSVSDIHGYLAEGRSALTTLGDRPEYAPIVEADEDGRLQWAGGDEYVLVVNGDLVDRGPDNEGVLALVERLAREAPPGHVRVTLGNHEWAVFFRDLVRWGEWFSGRRTDAERRQLCDAVDRGGLVAAYEGHSFTYAHAGLAADYEAATLNDRFVDAALELREAVGAPDDAETQHRLVDDYAEVLGLGGRGGRGPGAGIAWLDFQFLPDEAQPQIVGHTQQERPVRKGNVVCENVIRANRSGEGGEAVLVETPEALVALQRTGDGGVDRWALDAPDPESR